MCSLSHALFDSLGVQCGGTDIAACWRKRRNMRLKRKLIYHHHHHHHYERVPIKSVAFERKMRSDTESSPHPLIVRSVKIIKYVYRLNLRISFFSFIDKKFIGPNDWIQSRANAYGDQFKWQILLFYSSLSDSNFIENIHNNKIYLIKRQIYRHIQIEYNHFFCFYRFERNTYVISISHVMLYK